MLRAIRSLSSAAAAVTQHGQQTVHHPFFVPRNSRGSLPVYSDVRNGGGRYLVSAFLPLSSTDASTRPGPDPQR